MREKLSFQGVFRKGDPDMPFRYLPFDVPPGTKRIDVSYHYTRDESVQPEWGSDDVVDIGMFDTRGTELLGDGFRGWTGSSRRSFFIARDDATPGYLRGPLQPGQWQVFLGCRMNFGTACPYWVNVSLDIDPNEANEPSPAFEDARLARPAPSTGPPRWFRGDFHSHTIYSDGLNTIDEFADTAERLGLDFLAITDHNTCSHFAEIATRSPAGPLLIPGEEVTTFWGHANVWGLGAWTDFRSTDDARMQRIVDWVHERGGLFSPNHPKTGWPWEFHTVRGFRVCETWQGAWRFYNEESLDFWQQRLNRGERVVAVGGSDAHSVPPAQRMQPWTLGEPCTWVLANDPINETSILDAVRAGHVFVSEDPTGPFLELTASCDGKDYLMGDTIDAQAGAPVRFRLRYRGPSEKKLRLLRNGEPWQQAVAAGEDVTLEFELPVDEPCYVRAAAMGFRGRPERGEVVHALTNPIYLAPSV